MLEQAQNIAPPVGRAAFKEVGTSAYRLIAVLQLLLLALAGVVVVASSATFRWSAGLLAVITALTIISDLTHVEVGTRRLKVSASFLGLMLAVVLLGGGPAALLGVIAIAVGRVRSREPAHYFRQNLVTYAWFPLLTGLLFHAVSHSAHLTPDDTAYYVVVFAAFAFALVLNFTMIVGYGCFLDGISLISFAREALVPILSPELFSAILTLVAIYLATHLGIFGLTLFALVLIVFQYLVGELLTSQRRGEELQKMATTDDLTGLANRKSFADHLTSEINTCSVTGEAFGVLMLDVDRFKEINDTLGHQYGDLLLKQLGPRLAERVGPNGMVARFGGDEFGILTGARTGSDEELGQIANDLIACVQEPIRIDDISIEIGSSIGIARYPADGTDVETLLRRVDIAMYAAKEHRDAYRVYDPQQDHNSPQRLRLLGDFRRALVSDEIVVHYQPIVDLGSQRVSGAESLVRWQHPELGLLYPDKFIQTVEQTSLIGPLTRYVLNRSIVQCAIWREAGMDLSIAVNLSVRNLVDPRLAEDVDKMLRRHNLPASALRLEITESMIMSDPERALATVTDLSRLGVRLAVDDFGTGHSSLANLRQLPIDELKIDRSFVTPMLHDENDLIIVRSTINMAHDLGLKTVAEGVEDASTLHELDDLGCDQVQGYHFSKPIPADTFMAWADAFQKQTV